MSYEEPNDMAAEQCRSFLETIEVLHELHTWANTDDEPSTLSLVARRELLDRGWAEDQDREAIAEAINQEIQEYPLSVQVRSGWESLGVELEPAEFLIELSTGSPCKPDCRGARPMATAHPAASTASGLVEAMD